MPIDEVSLNSGKHGIGAVAAFALNVPLRRAFCSLRDAEAARLLGRTALSRH
jgi:hypothetical protein